MKRKLLTILLTLVTVLCLTFGLVACDSESNSDNGGNTGDGSQTEQPDGSQGGNQEATHTHQFSSSWSSDDVTHWHAATCGHSVKQDESAHTYVNGICSTCNHAHVNHSYGNWRTVEEATCIKAGLKKRECSCGAVQTESIPQKDHSYANSVCIVCGAVEPGAVEVKVYIDNILMETLYTNSSKEYKIALPAKPEDMTTDPDLKNYFDGWYADKGCTIPLTGEETYHSSSAIYGRNIVNKGWGCKYEVNNGNVTITALKATSPTPSTDVVVPAYFNSFPVTKIGNNAAKDLSMIRNLYLCENLKEIGDYAFSNCNSMQKVVLPSSLTSIGSYAFAQCSSLQEVHITDLSAWCRIDFESGAANPLFYAHHLYVDHVELKELTIPNGITKIKPYMFTGCSGLESVTIGCDVTAIGEEAFCACSGLMGEFKIPDGVESIGKYTFLNCRNLTSIIIPGSVSSIGFGAFAGCSGLESVIFGENSHLHEIKDRAFADCTGLTSITLPKSVTDIGSCVFEGCTKLDKVYMPSGKWRYVVATHREDYPNGGFHIWSDFADVYADLSNPEIAASYLKSNTKKIFL